MRLAERDASAGASVLPGRILATLIAQESLPPDLRKRAEALANSVTQAKTAVPLEQLIELCLR